MHCNIIVYNTTIRISKTSRISLLGLLTILVLSASAHAIPSLAPISYVSGTVPNNTDLSPATSFELFPTGLVISATGDLTGVGATVTNTPGI